MLKLWPTDINPGTGTSILIAVAASTYLILQSEKFLSKVTGRTKKLDDTSEHCDSCKSKVEEVKDSSTLLTCKGCGSFISQEKCAEHTAVIDNWKCISCKRNSIIHQRTGEWFLKQLRELTDLTPPAPNAFRDNVLTINPAHAMQIKVRLEKVRELTEQYLAKILNGSLENTLVGKISNDAEYLYMFHKYHKKLSAFIFNYQKSLLGLPNPIPDANQNDLRRFINRICQEVVTISNTLDYTGVVNEHDDKLFTSDPRTYEQLVATAVLNKITENYHGNRKLFDSGIDDDVNVSAEGENALDEGLILQDFDRYQSQVQNREISLPTMLDKDLNFKGDDGSWEDNWFFKISQLNKDHGISMLVPSPSDENFKPLIGDKIVDEINDSDNESSSSFSNFEYENLHKDEIATKNVSKSLIIELPTQALEPKEHHEQHKQIQTVEQNEIILIESSKEAEKIENEITQITNSSPAIKPSDEALFEATSNEASERIDEAFEEILMNESYIVPGSIAEREKVKWLNAPPLANNPYSSEALKRRLSKLKLKNTLLDVSSENLAPPTPTIKSENESSEAFELREDIRKYKRDYYVNNSDERAEIFANGNHESRGALEIKTSRSEVAIKSDTSNTLHSPKILMKTSLESPRVIKTDDETSEKDLSSLSLISEEDIKIHEQMATSNQQLIKEVVMHYESGIESTNCETYEEKQVIEPEVVEFLPSVKKLAKLYSQEEEFDFFDTHENPITKSASESKVMKLHNNSQPLARPVASITARSLPTKVRTELKKSLTQTDIPVVSYSERNESPDIESGVTRKSIAYFEKLYT